jgi:hypothetical protein
MTHAPVEANVLILRHAGSTLGKRWDGKRVRQGKRSSGWRFKKDLVGNAAVFVLVTSALANILRISVSTVQEKEV